MEKSVSHRVFIPGKGRVLSVIDGLLSAAIALPLVLAAAATPQIYFLIWLSIMLEVPGSFSYTGSPVPPSPWFSFVSIATFLAACCLVIWSALSAALSALFSRDDPARAWLSGQGLRWSLVALFSLAVTAIDLCGYGTLDGYHARWVVGVFGLLAAVPVVAAAFSLVVQLGTKRAQVS